jgi:aromatic ring-cleaving dioxygenase
MPTISGYHAHVYFDADTVEQARALCEAARDALPVEMGRVHEKNVGPHPMWSCQLSFDADAFGQVFPWLTLNRNGLIIFTHPSTGQHLEDHRDRAIWMGACLALDLSIFG